MPVTLSHPALRLSRFAVLAAWLVGVCVLSLGARSGQPHAVVAAEAVPTEAAAVHGAPLAQPGPGSDSCLHCHEGIEDMHPAAQLSCVDCHGGDATTKNKFEAHVQPPAQRGEDERVGPLDDALNYRRFVNPMDMRVAERVCGDCHGQLVHDLSISLHGTTAGHLSDGFYEMGLLKERGSVYGVFPVSPSAAEEGEVERLNQPPAFSTRDDPYDLKSHFSDLIRKECMQCHLYSEGRAVRGRVGFDGDYRGDGCAACHVEYSLSGLSESTDQRAVRTEPGHPRRHTMTRAPSTQTCTSCHYGDASIGLHFRGLTQLPPGAVGGPEIPGTTESLLNRTYYIDDDSLCPPDIHHERGMHCVDCHTLSDVMGDGALHGQMEHAVEISCQACHGTLDERTKFVTERGTRLTHLFEEKGKVYLKSKVTGEWHPVKQIRDVVTPGNDDYNREAARAMTPDHGKLECYTCHSGANVNFLGFHFYRNEALSQLDLLSGRRTPGRVTTQEKVFTTWKAFYAGLNEEGRVAPYLTGFSTMGTVDDADGNRVLDQVMPETEEGLSGMTMIHHQMHSVRPTARSCVECHRNPGTWGLGTGNFRLARRLAFVADRRGIEVVAIDRSNLLGSTPLAKFVLPDIVDLELLCDPLQGHAEYLFASEGGRGVHVLDVRDPRAPKRVAFVECVSPRGLAIAGDHLYVADGVGGLRVFDIEEPEEIERVGVVPMMDAHDVELRWPWAYVADGPGGVAIVDIRAPIAPRVIGGHRVTRSGGEPMVVDVDVLFQHSRPQVGGDGKAIDERSEARNLLALVDEQEGLVLLDVTEPTQATKIWPERSRRTQARRARRSVYRSVVLRSKVEVAPPQGGVPTRELDLAYLLEEQILENGDSRGFLHVVDVTGGKGQPLERTRAGDQVEALVHASFYNQPILQPVAFVPANDGVYAVDLSVSDALNPLALLPGLLNAYHIAVEEFPLDKMRDESGRALKDVSHEGSRWLLTAEIDRVLSVPASDLELALPDEAPALPPWATARAHLRRHDRDLDGMLSGRELEDAGATLDRNGDGRVVLMELAAEERVATGEDRTSTGEDSEEPVVFRSERVGPDGDLARLFDGLDPVEFDRNDDLQLDRKEMSRALFAALDLDGDKRLTRAELSRHPGRPRQIRYGDAGALEIFKKRDLNKGGTIGMRELSIQDAEWDVLDVDGDGRVQLPVPRDPAMRQTGTGPPPVEWPTRRDLISSVAPNSTAEAVLERYDRSEDGNVSRREFGKREDLWRELDLNLDGAVDTDELTRHVNRVLREGSNVWRDDFVGRWDLDGDGEVDPEELPTAALVALRQRGLMRD